MQEIVVKFHDYIDLPYEDDIGDEIETRGVGAWRDIESEFSGVTIQRLFTETTPDEIHHLVERAKKQDATYRPPNFLTYFSIDCPGNHDSLELLRLLRGWRSVETAYMPGELVPTSTVAYADDPLFTSGAQGFLHAAPEGIGSLIYPTATVPYDRGAWAVPGGEGGADDLRFINIEHGWKFDHRDLELTDEVLIAGENSHQLSPVTQTYTTSHGTAVLGIVTGNDNALDGLGIVPNLNSSEAVSVANLGIEDALLHVARTLRFGDVALLEIGSIVLDTTESNQKWLPVEVFKAAFDVIRLCTALGIVIIEGAANGVLGQNGQSLGGIDLDGVASLTHSDGETPLVEIELNRNSNEFNDSGAIMVGASKDVTFQTERHKRADFSNYGSRIDCFGWGGAVTTLSTANNENPDALEDAFTGDFGGTSAASAIIAGAALSIQSMAQINLNYRFSPQQLRGIMSREPQTEAIPGQPVPPDLGNTPSNDPENDQIGVMPNLWWIAEEILNVTPDVYIRDHIGDTGDPHEAATLWKSPDIFVRPSESDDPQAEFGEGSDTENSNTLGATVYPDQDNYVYVRVKNRGGADIEDVTVTIYYSPPSTLTMGDLWTELGSVSIPTVPMGDQLVVSEAIAWEEDDIPEPGGHYCFIALVGSEQDPAPEPANFLDMDTYRQFVRDRNNVAWRNFNVASSTPEATSNWVKLAFMAPGAPKKSYPMALEIHAGLPKGSKARLELPARFARRFRVRSEPVESTDLARIRLNPHGRTSLGEASFDMGSRTEMELHVSIPEEFRKRTYEISARQLHDGDEVGCVSWQLAPLKKEL